ncbi:hypothetical protein V6N13_128026 [Hibiscus sabdariffa]
MLNKPETLQKARDELDSVIGKNSHVILSRIALGRNPKVWDEPCEFKPERHLQNCNKGEEVVITEPELRLFSFSRGRRGCPGVVLGSSMATMMFARLLHGFDWNTPANQGTVDLSQGKGVPFLAKPLLAVAKPRLPPNVYPFQNKYMIIVSGIKD